MWYSCNKQDKNYILKSIKLVKLRNQIKNSLFTRTNKFIDVFLTVVLVCY